MHLHMHYYTCYIYRGHSWKSEVDTFFWFGKKDLLMYWLWDYFIYFYLKFYSYPRRVYSHFGPLLVMTICCTTIFIKINAKNLIIIILKLNCNKYTKIKYFHNIIYSILIIDCSLLSNRVHELFRLIKKMSCQNDLDGIFWWEIIFDMFWWWVLNIDNLNNKRRV